MCALLNVATMRGRSLVPDTLLRMRYRRSCFSRFLVCGVMFVAPRIWPRLKLLLDGLAFLPLDALVSVLHTLALVRLRRIERAQLGGNLANDLFARTFDRDLRVFLNCHFDLVRNIVIDR